MDRIRRAPFVAAALAAGLAACGHGASHQQATSAPEHQALTNPSSFALFPRSQVVTVVPITSAQMYAAMKASDPKTSLPRPFKGNEVIAETGATMAQLRSWVKQLAGSPPKGLRLANASDSINGDAMQGEQFENATGTRTVLVIAADPRRIHDEMGPAFALIDSYDKVPGMMRGPIDDQAKKQLGYSVSEMLDARSPVGAVIAEIKHLQTSSDRRAILLIDSEQPK